MCHVQPNARALVALAGASCAKATSSNAWLDSYRRTAGPGPAAAFMSYLADPRLMGRATPVEGQYPPPGAFSREPARTFVFTVIFLAFFSAFVLACFAIETC